MKEAGGQSKGRPGRHARSWWAEPGETRASCKKLVGRAGGDQGVMNDASTIAHLWYNAERRYVSQHCSEERLTSNAEAKDVQYDGDSPDLCAARFLAPLLHSGAPARVARGIAVR